ncbi:RrF2 family transcriptional regulator [Sphingomonas montanisoli]|uniref:Rrf2 family transcriptional regulator n=1 Tax=Sphingomonas montanisoli TaxID=2606412 RepID=A0A5D9BZL4_9SPHN|nr:Rrf2 family transcriptional regulator [Sphingomonas montanisoli]TZG24643.1 Rrf2 family transcriptional regulator [Sphingomonas montanisoli]
MRLSTHTDYALRVLIHLAAKGDRLASIAEIARAFSISENHLMKVVHMLGRAGFVRTVRGRGGGIALARPPQEINIGAVVRHGEAGFDLADCPSCVIAPACGLNGALAQALGAFLAVLDGYSLADITVRKDALAALLGISKAAGPPSAPVHRLALSFPA